MRVVSLEPPYLLFLGSETTPTYAKTGAGLAQWRPELCMGQLRLTPETVDVGLADHSVASAAAQGAKTLIIGTALVGGSIPESWLSVLVEALESGLDIAAGVHTRLDSIEVLAEAATRCGQKLIDVRIPPPNIPVGTGLPRSGKRLLTVGTDCAVGKKYTALALEAEMRNRNLAVDFRATGQTGIMIAGQGFPIDAVVADFVSGAAELVSPVAEPDHWDIIEGQGGIFHPGYAAVSMGLLMGSQPDVFVVCTEAGRTHIEGWEDFELPSIQAVIDRTIDIGFQLNSAIRCVGISANTQSLTDDQRAVYLEGLSKAHGVPAVDPLITGVSAIVDELVAS